MVTGLVAVAMVEDQMGKAEVSRVEAVETQARAAAETAKADSGEHPLAGMVAVARTEVVGREVVVTARAAGEMVGAEVVTARVAVVRVPVKEDMA